MSSKISIKHLLLFTFLELNVVKGTSEEIVGVVRNTSEETLVDTTHFTTSANPTMLTNETYLSNIYNKIMKNYDKKFRPNFSGNATNVFLDIQILSFSDIDERSMEFGIEFYFLQLWQDPRFQVVKDANQASISIIGNEIDKQWLPDTVFVNSKTSTFHQITVNNRFLLADFTTGEMAYHARISTKASCLLDLHDYPFDIQHCFLAIESYGYGAEELVYQWWMPTKIGFPFIKIYIKEMANYNVIKAIKSNNRTLYNHDEFSCATAKFTFQRRSNYFIIQVYLPSILIVMVTWSSFWISSTAVPARSSICVTAILTLITMLGIVNVNMPKVSYVKALDLYLFVCFIFVFLSLLEFIIVMNVDLQCYSNISSDDNQLKEKCKRILYKRAGFRSPSNKYNTNNSMTSSNNTTNIENNNKVNAVWQRRCSDVKRTKSFTETVINIEEEATEEECFYKNLSFNKANKLKTSKTATIENKESSVIDVISRVLFPLTFACFNLGYWFVYLSIRNEVEAV